MRIAIYTCVTNNYDNIVAPLIVTKGVDYLFFSDGSVVAPTPWENIPIDDLHAGKDANRYIKIMPHLNSRLSEYDLTIYVDGAIDVIGDLTSLLDKVVKTSGDLFMYQHPSRNCVYLEARSCIENRQAPIRETSELMKKFRGEGIPKNYGLYEAGVIIRKPSKAVKKFMEVWWSIYISGVKRDQLALIYALWKTSFQVHSLGMPDHRREQLYFRCRFGHNGDFIKRYFLWFIWRPLMKFIINMKLISL
jgi:hypothetical protein